MLIHPVVFWVLSLFENVSKSWIHKQKFTKSYVLPPGIPTNCGQPDLSQTCFQQCNDNVIFHTFHTFLLRRHWSSSSAWDIRYSLLKLWIWVAVALIMYEINVWNHGALFICNSLQFIKMYFLLYFCCTCMIFVYYSSFMEDIDLWPWWWVHIWNLRQCYSIQ